MQLFLKMLSAMANSADLDQTAPSGAVWSVSALFVYAILSETLVYKSLGHLPYHIFCKHLDRQTYATNVDSDQGPQCLPLMQQLSHTPIGSKMDMFKF